MRRSLRLILPLAAILATGGASAQLRSDYDDIGHAREAMRVALEERDQAADRSTRLEREAAAASGAADRSRHEAAALAARIQQAEAGMDAAEARLALLRAARGRLQEELGREQRPVVELTAALQQFARRPAGLALLRSGSVQDVVHLRAILSNTAPEIDRRTQALRTRLARGRQLQQDTQQALAALRSEEETLSERRRQLAALEVQQRVASRQAGGSAAREAERALALAEQARDLDSLLGVLDAAGQRRDRLAALPGPVLRPDRPDQAPATTSTTPALADQAPASLGSARPPAPYQLPVTGRLVRGFGAPGVTGLSQGVTLAPRAGAQVVAPADGRVVFAGPYRGYDGIVIIEHSGGWASLVTGLSHLQAEVGDELVGGAPIGLAGADRPAITLELRQGGQPVSPLQYLE